MNRQLLFADVTGVIRQAAFETHQYFGSGFLEKVYKNALTNRLRAKGLQVVADQPIQVFDEDGTCVGEYVADLVVEACVLVELKAVRALASEHSGQVLNYLKATGVLVGLLINFGATKLQFRRFVYEAARTGSRPVPSLVTTELSDTT